MNSIRLRLITIVLAIVITSCPAYHITANNPPDHTSSAKTPKLSKIRTLEEFESLISDMTKSDEHHYNDSITTNCAELLNDYAVYLIEHDGWHMSHALIQEAKRICPKSEKELLTVITATEAGYEFMSGNIEKAHGIWMQLLGNKEYVLDEIDRIKISINLGEYTQRKGDLKSALEYFNSAMKMSESIGDKHLLAVAIIHAEHIEDNNHIKLELLKKAGKIVFNNNFTGLIARTHIAEARYFFRQRDFENSIKCLEKATISAKKSNQLKYETEALQLLAKIYHMQGNLSLAHNYLEEVNELRSNSLKDSYKIADTHSKLADKLLYWSYTHCRKSIPEDKSSRILPLIIAFISFIVILLLGWWLMRKRKISQQIHTNGEESQPYKTENRRFDNEVAKLEILYAGMNSTFLRVRQSLRSIKGSEIEMQNQIRELSSQLIRCSLPERKNEYIKQIENSDDEILRKIESRFNVVLNPADRKLAIYLIHGLSTQEICAITGHLPKSINQARYRLRKSLGLNNEDNLEEILAEYSKCPISDVVSTCHK